MITTDVLGRNGKRKMGESSSEEEEGGRRRTA
jgi:hypothetical protein